MSDNDVGVTVASSVDAAFVGYDQTMSGRIEKLPVVTSMPPEQAKAIWTRIFNMPAYAGFTNSDKTLVLELAVLSAVKLTTSPLANYNGIKFVISAGAAADTTTGAASTKGKVFDMADLRNAVTTDGDAWRGFFGNFVMLANKLLQDTTNQEIVSLRAVLARRYNTNSPAMIPWCFDFALCQPEVIPQAVYNWLKEHKVHKVSTRVSSVGGGKLGSDEVVEDQRRYEIAQSTAPSTSKIRGLGGL